MHKKSLVLARCAAVVALACSTLQANGTTGQRALESFKLEEATIADIHAAMSAGKITSAELVKQYLARINAYDQKGPKLNSIILLNPEAMNEANTLEPLAKRIVLGDLFAGIGKMKGCGRPLLA